jgi:dTDP-4-dehydrorhamnose reductase
MDILDKPIVLVLGHTGMLGHIVKKYLEQFYTVETVDARWPSAEFKTEIKNFKATHIVNCIGAIHQRTKDFDVNFELPIWLDFNFDGKIIHPGTDCEIDDDEYGNSKRVAAEWILQNGKNTKIIKTSIIGPELNSSSSFLYWFLSNADGSTVRGYSNHKWNGNTTYFWAKHCKLMIDSWESYPTQTILQGNTYSKFEMLNIFNAIYSRNIKINDFKTEKDVDKCLIGDILTPPLEVQIKEMNLFYNENR